MSKIVSRIEEEGMGSINDLTRKAVVAAIAFVALDAHDGSVPESFHNWEKIGTKEVFEKLETFQFVKLICGEDGVNSELSRMYRDLEVSVVLDRGKEYLKVSEELKEEILSYAEQTL